jgi:hypothetical protein
VRDVVVETVAVIATIIEIDLTRVDPVGLTRAYASLVGLIQILGTLETLGSAGTRGIHTIQGTAETAETLTMLAMIIGRLVANSAFVKRPQVASALTSLLLILGTMIVAPTLTSLVMMGRVGHGANDPASDPASRGTAVRISVVKKKRQLIVFYCQRGLMTKPN